MQRRCEAGAARCERDLFALLAQREPPCGSRRGTQRFDASGHGRKRFGSATEISPITSLALHAVTNVRATSREWDYPSVSAGPNSDVRATAVRA